MKMTVKTEHYDVGVIVGRFQVPELHDAHRALIQHVSDQHNKVIVFLGVSPLWSTRENPLDFESRKQMLLAEFPHINVLYIKDVNNDDVWSKRLDSMIKDVVTPHQTVVLYGGRESFVDHYTGKYPTRELQQDVWVSGTEIREGIARSQSKATPDWRAGVIWGAYSRFPICYPTVDVAVIRYDQTERGEIVKVLLGRKPNEMAYRFVGGFAEPDSPSYEDDARREVREELGIEIYDPIYIGSYQIDDWRYRNEIDKIKTLFFVAEYKSGVPRPADDIEEARWATITPDNATNIIPEHQPLMDAFKGYLQDQILEGTR